MRDVGKLRADNLITSDYQIINDVDDDRGGRSLVSLVSKKILYSIETKKKNVFEFFHEKNPDPPPKKGHQRIEVTH